MNFLKTYISLAAVGIAVTTPAAYADGIELSEKLSVTGFIDMSFVYTDPDSGDSDSSADLDQFEINFLYTFDDKLTAQVDLEYQDDPDPAGTPDEGKETDIEQAFFTYAYTDKLSIKAGRFLSYSGWETEEPTGLYQYSSTGYAKYFYGAYQQGLSGYYDGEGVDIALSVVNDLGDLLGSGTDNRNIATELMVAVNPFEGLTAKAFYMTEGETDLINFWTSYVTGGLTLAFEYNTSENAGAAVAIAGVDAEANGYLLMVNYAWKKFGITVRYHESEIETSGGVSVEELSGITFSPSYRVSDNLLLVAEYRSDDDDLTDSGSDTFALEALVTF